MPEEQAEKAAYEWIVRHDRANASWENACKAFKAALLWCEEVRQVACGSSFAYQGEWTVRSSIECPTHLAHGPKAFSGIACARARCESAMSNAPQVTELSSKDTEVASGG